MACALIASLCAVAAPARRYAVYAPKITWHTIYRGRLGDGACAYNHCASLAWFNGKFFAVWNGNPTTVREGKPGQVLQLATSYDFVRWSTSQHFVGAGAANPLVDPKGIQWQPCLLNYKGRELWCIWLYHTDDRSRRGTYLSRLSAKPGAKWMNQRIFERYLIDGEAYVGFTTQNPVLLRSGRVLAPLTLYRRISTTHRRHFNVCLYTDDGGKTWRVSNPISRVDDDAAQWEPFFYEQADGRLRAFMRNLTRATPPCTNWQLTCTGAGAAKGEPVRFDPDPKYSWIETANSRGQVFRVRGGRYCMLQHDVHVNHRGYETRLNLALFFSRSGADDYAAGVPFSRKRVISAYPQGIEHDGKIYIAYTTGSGRGPRSIEGAAIDPAPAPDRFYIWPRERDMLIMETLTDAQGRRYNAPSKRSYRTSKPAIRTHDGRRCLWMRRQSSAGVEIDPVDWAKGRSLSVELAVKPLKLQQKGFMVFASFGDRIPIRLAMPANRPGMLYAYTADEWRPVGPMPLEQWSALTARFGRDTFRVKVGDAAPKTFRCPIVAPNPRLYLGDGYEVDYVRSNWGSEFMIDLASVKTQAR